MKFKDDKFNNWSDDKYDEWLTEEQLEDAKKVLAAYKKTASSPGKQLTIQRIRGYDPDRNKALVQWSLYPKEMDWTWEDIDNLSEQEYTLLLPFITQYN